MCSPVLRPPSPPRQGIWISYPSPHDRRIPSLQEYLLVAQAEPRVERYRRQGDRQWVLTEALALDATIELPSIGAILALGDVYDGAL